jgi:predicted Zn-ribbon and HTH transcriptional regulator
MKNQRLICKKCGYHFQAEVLEEGEAEEKRIRPAPIRCPKCGSQDIEND